jgi:hypothetical protein
VPESGATINVGVMMLNIVVPKSPPNMPLVPGPICAGVQLIET